MVFEVDSTVSTGVKLPHPLTAPSLCNVARVSRRPGFHLLSIGCFHTQLAVFSEAQASAREPVESAAGDLLPAGRRGGGVGNVCSG